MITNLKKETIFNLYKCKLSLKNSDENIGKEFEKTFDDELKNFIDKKEIRQWNYILLILLFKFGKISAIEVFKMFFPNEISHKRNCEYNRISLRLGILFKQKICYRISLLSDEGRQYYEYYLNYENKDFEINTFTDRIIEYVESNRMFSCNSVYEYVYQNQENILNVRKIRTRIVSQLVQSCKNRKIKLFSYPNGKYIRKVYYTDPSITEIELSNKWKELYEINQ